MRHCKAPKASGWCVGLYPQSKFRGDRLLSSVVQVSVNVTAASMLRPQKPLQCLLGGSGTRASEGSHWGGGARLAAVHFEVHHTLHRNWWASTLTRQARGLLDVRFVSLEVVASAAAGNSMHAQPKSNTLQATGRQASFWSRYQNSYTYAPTYMHAFISHIHVYTYPYIHRYLYEWGHMRMYIDTGICTYVHIHVHSYVHTCIRTCIRTYIHMYIWNTKPRFVCQASC